MAVDCLAGYLYALKQDGKAMPTPSDLQAIRIEHVARELEIDDVQESFVNLVSVDVPSYAKAHFERSVKKTLTIPEWLNVAAEKRGVNFSAVLQDALRNQLNL